MTRREYDAIREMLGAYVAVEAGWHYKPLSREQAALAAAYDKLSDIAASVAEIDLVDDREDFPIVRIGDPRHEQQQSEAIERITRRKR